MELKRFCIIGIFLLGSVACKSQMIDSLIFFLHNNYSIDARLSTKLSLIDHQLTKVSGLRLGVVFQRKLRIGGGIDWLKTDYSRGINWMGIDPVTRDFVNESNEKTTKYYKLMYFCFYADFVFHKTKHWQLSVPIQIGTGASWFNANSGYTFGNPEPKYFVFLYEPGITVQYKLTKWLGGGIDVCYRFSPQNSKRTNIPLNSPSYAFKLVFLLDQLYYDLFPESELTKTYGPAYW